VITSAGRQKRGESFLQVKSCEESWREAAAGERLATVIPVDLGEARNVAVPTTFSVWVKCVARETVTFILTYPKTDTPISMREHIINL
jgi:hypothetical protein